MNITCKTIDEYQPNMLAYCGLYCEQCSFRSAHDENDLKHLENLPFPFEIKDLSVYNCEGCKGFCICGVCRIKPCALEKGIENCTECNSFPCEHIEAFENDGMSHHKDAVSNLKYIRQHGIEEWFRQLKPSLRCQVCGEKQSWYYSCLIHNKI